MATFHKLASGKYQAQIYKLDGGGNLCRKSKSFKTKREAVDWARRVEFELESVSLSSKIQKTTLAELLDRYALNVSIHKKGKRWEVIRLKKLAKSEFASKPLSKISNEDFAKWRDAELARGLKGESIRRELTLFSAVFNIAEKEWGYEGLKNPARAISWPKASAPRDRRISDEEIERLQYVMGYVDGTAPENATQRVFVAFLFAIETAMRAGEITKLTWADVDVDTRIASLYDTKNGHNRRVPLSTRAIELLNLLPKNDPIFGFKGDQISTLFAKSRRKADINDLHFHDTRHEAITRLAQKVHVLDLAKITGHKDLKKLMGYYDESIESIAKKIN